LKGGENVLKGYKAAQEDTGSGKLNSCGR